MLTVVTGSEGFLGRALVAALASRESNVVAVDRIYHAGPPIEGVVYHHADIEDPALLLPPTVARDTSFALIHLAWDMRRYQGYGIQAGQVRQFANLLDYWGERGLQRVIAMGSAEEYGRCEGYISERTEPVFPLSPYGWGKRCVRDLAESWSERTGIAATVLRPFIMYGPGQRGDMLIPSAIEAARSRQPTAFSDGSQQRDFIHIDDVVAATVLAWKNDLPGFQEFNLGAGEGILVADVLKGIADHLDAEAFIQIGARPRRSGEPSVQIAESLRARDILGWQPRISLAQGLASLCAIAPFQLKLHK